MANKDVNNCKRVIEDVSKSAGIRTYGSKDYGVGYIIVDLSESDIYNKLLIAKDLNKPILIKDESQNYFVDRLSIDDDTSDIALTCTNSTITITDADVVTKTSNPDTSELNEIKDYVDTIKDNITYDEENEAIEINAVSKLTFNDASEISTAPHLYRYDIYFMDAAEEEFSCYVTFYSNNNNVSVNNFNDLKNIIKDYGNSSDATAGNSVISCILTADEYYGYKLAYNTTFTNIISVQKIDSDGYNNSFNITNVSNLRKTITTIF